MMNTYGTYRIKNINFKKSKPARGIIYQIIKETIITAARHTNCKIVHFASICIIHSVSPPVKRYFFTTVGTCDSLEISTTIYK